MTYQEKYEWDVDDYLPLDQFESKLAEATSLIHSLDDWWEKLSPEMETSVFSELVTFFESIDELLNAVYNCGFLRLSTDQSNQQFRLMESKVDSLYHTYAEKSTRFWHWIQQLPIDGKKQLDAENAARLYATRPDLDYFFKKLVDEKQYALSEPEEQIEASKMLLSEALNSTYSLIKSEMRYTVHFPDGREETFDTLAEVSPYFESPDRKIRKAAAAATLEESKKHFNKQFVIYEGLVKQTNFSIEKRSYASPLQQKTSEQGLDQETITVLLDVCRKNTSVLSSFFDAMQKILGVDELKSYDLRAPLGEVQKDIPLSDALSLIFDCFDSVDPDFSAKAQSIITRKHFDSHPQKGKRGGGFCTWTPADCSYILANYVGTADSVSTVAHELGHAVHNNYASKHSSFTNHPITPIAETASTFAEAIVTDKLIEQAPNVLAKRHLLGQRILDAYGTALTQAKYTFFEIESHKKIKDGVTLDELSVVWKELTNEFNAHKVTYDREESKYMWLNIPHLFGTPFYCYAYSFGYLLSLSLYRSYKQDHSFFKKIEHILSAGSSKKPEDILSDVGIDIRSEAFWQQGFDVIKEWVDEFVLLVDE